MTAAMTVAPAKDKTADGINRQRTRKSHKKSRRGCSSCKLRRVRCDEAKPACRKCKDYGVACKYDGKISGLTFAGEGSFCLTDSPLPLANAAPETRSLSQTPIPQPLNHTSAIVAHLNGLPSPPTSDGEDICPFFGPASIEIFKKFNERTVLSVGTSKAARVYQREIFQLACTNHFLGHIVIAVTLLQDRYLAGKHTMNHNVLSHWHQGTSKFKDTLFKPIRNESKDALWASAALLGIVSIANFEAEAPEDAWPLRPSTPHDLDWLKLAEGKKAVFTIANPLRTDSVFHEAWPGHATQFRPMVEEHLYHENEVVAMTRDFSDLYDLGPGSTKDGNPYYHSAMYLARLLHVKCDASNITEFLGVIMHIQPELNRLLDLKDPKALMLLVLWYAKLYKGQWWLYRRGLIEGKAICMYLDRHYGDDARLQRMLQWPKTELGLIDPVHNSMAGTRGLSDGAAVLSVM